MSLWLYKAVWNWMSEGVQLSGGATLSLRRQSQVKPQVFVAVYLAWDKNWFAWDKNWLSTRAQES